MLLYSLLWTHTQPISPLNVAEERGNFSNTHTHTNGHSLVQRSKLCALSVSGSQASLGSGLGNPFASGVGSSTGSSGLGGSTCLFTLVCLIPIHLPLFLLLFTIPLFLTISLFLSLTSSVPYPLFLILSSSPSCVRQVAVLGNVSEFLSSSLSRVETIVCL